MGFPCGSAGKESASNAGDLGSIPGLGRSPGEGKGYPLQCSGLENSMDSSCCKSQTELSTLTFTAIHIVLSILVSQPPLSSAQSIYNMHIPLPNTSPPQPGDVVLCFFQTIRLDFVL